MHDFGFRKVSPAKQLWIQQVGFVNSRHFFQHRSCAKDWFKNLNILAMWFFCASSTKKSWSVTNRKAYLHNFVTLQCHFWWINPLNQNYLLILKYNLFSIIQAVTFSNQGGFHLHLLVFPFVYQFNYRIVALKVSKFQNKFILKFTDL